MHFNLTISWNCHTFLALFFCYYFYYNYRDEMSENVKEVQGHTRILTEACIFTWSIENFSLCSSKDDEYLTSPSFTAGKFQSPIWHLRLFPNKKRSTESVPHIGIYLVRTGAEPSSLCVSFQISIMASDKTKGLSRKFAATFKTDDPSWGWAEVIPRNELLKNKQSSLLPNDRLTVMCDMKVSFGVATSDGKEELIVDNSISSVSKQRDILIGSLQHLHESEMFSDLIIKVGNEELKVHKLILSARSSVFYSMFTTDMKESITNCLEITDFDPSVVKAMLRYIYCGQVDDLTPDLGIQLYSIADKYNLQGLKDICVAFLVKNVNVNNICDVLLVLCDLHNEQELMVAAKDFFCVNAAAIQETEKWRDLSKTFPDLAIAMYQFAISQK